MATTNDGNRRRMNGLVTGMLAVGLVGPSAWAQTITVNTLNDVTDFGGAQQVADLPGPDGKVSFREACKAANNTPGPQTIGFAIPAAEWWLGNQQALLRLEDGPFSLNDDETTVDFTTQTEVTGDTNPNGWEVGIYGLQPNGWGGAAIFVNGDRCVIKGLDRVMQRGYGVEVVGHDNRVIMCTISGSLYAGVKIEGNVGNPATGNVIGSTEPGEGNRLSGGNAGIRIDGPAEDNVVIGNTLIGSPYAGIQVRGAYCCPEYTPVNNRIGGPTPAEANWIAGNGKFGEEGFPEGDQVEVEYAVGTLVEGNIIGTTADGSAQYTPVAGIGGVTVRDSVDTTIRGNLISGIRKMGVNHAAGQLFGSAIDLRGPNVGVVIQGNLVGTDAAGVLPVPNLNGITHSWYQGYTTDAAVGGLAAGEGNVVAFNERRGISVDAGDTGVTILGNSIHSNGLLGIDLLGFGAGSAGVTPNDSGDGDTGGNGLQNFPVIVSAAGDGFATQIDGTLDSIPNEEFTLEFFLNTECDPSGHGEGQTFLGRIDVVTDASGWADFAPTLVGEVQDGQQITATATRLLTGETSEFSACVPIDLFAEDTVPPFIVHDPSGDPVTAPFSGFIDPRRESTNGIDYDQGLTEFTVVFSEPVRDLGGTELTAAAFTVRESGGSEPPAVQGIVSQDGRVVTVLLDRAIRPGVWTTIQAAVEDLAANPIPDGGDMGPEAPEPDRVDVAFLPADVDQSGTVTPLDLLTFRQYVSGTEFPEAGTVTDYVDMDRDGAVMPFDLLAYRQLINGAGNATQPWAGASLLHSQP